ncbi:peptidoglycan recognition protein family protein [Paenibacillus chitinolyticus]|uniref:peptidoglycan recognition protein family protein n=1 Tax=Paenibacillus chitinolyticus TaxID=79263 RepID=UPI00366BAA59
MYLGSIEIHHSLMTSGNAAAFANYHTGTNDWPGIAYMHVIDRDGTVNWCWDWDVIPYHLGDSNRRALGICLVGDFRTQQPTVVQYAAALVLVRM